MIYLGNNLLPEDFETGEFKIDGTSEISDLEPITVIAYSGDNIKDPDGTPSTIFKSINQSGYYINGIPQTVAFILATSGVETNRMIGYLSLSNNSDYVVACFTVPKLAVKDFMTDENSLLKNGHASDGVFLLCSGSNLTTSFTQSETIKTFNARPNSIDGYTPRNKKLLQYPFLYFGYNPQNGNQKIFRYEDFGNETPAFKIISEVNPNPTICLLPQNYRGDQNNVADASILNGYPTLSTRSDTFNIWLAQNSNIINLQTAQETVNYGINNAKSLLNAGMGSIQNDGSGIQQAFESGSNILQNYVNHEFYIANQMAQIEKQKMLPDKVNLGSSATLLGYNYQKKDIFVRYSIKSQFARRIDKYFDMYGYLTNERKIPNINNRPNWNYVKTIGCNIVANIPQTDLQTIKDIFDNGVTLWHNPTTFLDYSQNNR